MKRERERAKSDRTTEVASVVLVVVDDVVWNCGEWQRLWQRLIIKSWDMNKLKLTLTEPAIRASNSDCVCVCSVFTLCQSM